MTTADEVGDRPVAGKRPRRARSDAPYLPPCGDLAMHRFSSAMEIARVHDVSVTR
jgi:hypothetical protein